MPDTTPRIDLPQIARQAVRWANSALIDAMLAAGEDPTDTGLYLRHWRHLLSVLGQEAAAAAGKAGQS